MVKAILLQLKDTPGSFELLEPYNQQETSVPHLSEVTRMKMVAAMVLVAWFGSLCLAAELPHSTPEAQGISSAAILSFIEAADKHIDSLHSFMLLRHGQVVAQGWWSPYSTESPHSLFSLSKSFTSTAVGMAIAEGKLRLDDEVLKFFPEDAPAHPSANLKAMRVCDLLRMSTGQQTEPPRPMDRPWTKAFLEHPVPFKPGTHFLYNTSGTYMLSAIVQKATGKTLLDYLRPRLFEPLGIDHPTWESSPQGISTGGYGLSIRTRDIASFGQLYLQKGKWHGKQLVPAAWVEEATARQTSNGSNPSSDWDQGYGYQFWRCRHGAYRGDGAFGQYCIIMPELDVVIAMTGGLKDMQAVLNLVWDHLLPGMKQDPLPSDDTTQARLEKKLRGLSLRRPEGSGSGARVLGRKFVFARNDMKLEAITLEKEGKEGTVTIVRKLAGAEQRMTCGLKDWQKGRVSGGPPGDRAIAACGAWTDDDTFTATICYVETPFIETLTVKRSRDELECRSDMNVGFGPTHRGKLVGKPEPSGANQP